MKGKNAIKIIILITLVISISMTQLSTASIIPTQNKEEIKEENEKNTKPIDIMIPIIGSGIIDIELGDVSSIPIFRLVGRIYLYFKITSNGPDKIIIGDKIFNFEHGSFLIIFGFDGAFIDDGPLDNSCQIIGTCSFIVGWGFK